MKLRVCLITTSRVGEAIGGEELFTLHLGSWLERRGHVVFVMSRRIWGLPRVTSRSSETLQTLREKRALAFRTMYLPYPIYALSLVLFSLSGIVRLSLLRQKHGLDILHAQDTGYSGILALAGRALFGTPCLVHAHGVRHQWLRYAIDSKFMFLYKWWELLVDRLVSKRADRLVAVSEHVKQQFTQIGADPTNIDVIPSPLWTWEQRSNNRPGAALTLRKRLGIRDEALTIGFVGRLSPEKGADILLKSFIRAKTSGLLPKSAQLLIVGDGICRKDLGLVASEAAMNDSVVFAGLRTDVAELLCIMDIFVFASREDGRGLTLLEAIRSGRAIIAADLPTTREVITPQVNGLIVPVEDIESLASALGALAHEPALRRRLAAGALSTSLESFQEDSVFRRVEENYLRLVLGRRETARYRS
jgi:glycosyltransferase involved in cell wall biosynthesis